MQTQETFIDNLKNQLKYGGMSIRLIFINVIVFLGIRILDVFAQLGGGIEGAFIENYLTPVFGLHTELSEFFTHPWTLFTSIFAHYDAWHLIWNMVFLYFAGRLFEQLFNQKRLLYTYVLGGILGGVLEIIAHLIFPSMQFSNDIVIGASGSIMAIFIAIAFYRPNLTISLFGILPVRIIILALIFIVTDLLNLDSSDGTAHFAHLGGAILGVWSIQNIQSSGNIVNQAIKLMQWFSHVFSKNDNSTFKVKKGGKSKSKRFKPDEDYNSEKKDQQIITDKILDKISKSGYESLTKKEKDFLFTQSKNG